MKNTIVNNNKKIWLLTFLAATVIFLGLYHPFLFGGQVYAYLDIGSDTINQYVPMLAFEGESLRSGETGIYNLQYGLGAFCSPLFYKSMRLSNLPLLLFGPDHFHIGLILITYIKYMLICLFSLLFFGRLFREQRTAAICSLLWTYSGFNVLWGQHYHFLTAVLAFTVAMYGFQLFLEEDRKRFLVIPAVACLAANSYYHLYMSMYFFLIYGVLYLAFRGKKPLYILKRAGMFALAMIPVCGLAAFYLLPSMESFFGSTRVSDVTAGGLSGLFYSPSYIMALMSRVLSNNLLGIGNHFRGPTNYYECAILSVSVLFVFSFVYLLQGRYWKRTLALTVFGTLTVCMPVFSRILVFSETNQRWTFLLCFAEVLCIGFALKDGIHTRQEIRKRMLRTVVIGDVLIGGAVGILLFQHFRVGGWVHIYGLFVLAAILVLYHLVFFAVWHGFKPFGVLLLGVVLELIIGNYATVNQRSRVSLEQWKTDLYHDGTAQVVDWIGEQDDSLYRINKTYDSMAHNDAMIQGYNGLAIYSSTNSQELSNLYQSFDFSLLMENVSSWIRFGGDDLLSNAMLGVKYVITDGQTPMDPVLYELIHTDGKFQVYRNRNYLGFGYIYREQMPESQFLQSDHEEKTALLSRYWYRTGSEEGKPAALPQDAASGLQALARTSVRNFRQDRKGFYGEVTGPAGQGSMLCMALVYSDRWKADVDGIPAECININGGLLGIPISPGVHEIRITYDHTAFTLGAAISGVTALMYLFYLVVSNKRKK